VPRPLAVHVRVLLPIRHALSLSLSLSLSLCSAASRVRAPPRLAPRGFEERRRRARRQLGGVGGRRLSVRGSSWERAGRS
jgi:hypothetical protein